MEQRTDIDLTDLDRFAGGPPMEDFRRLRDDAPLHWQEPTRHTPGGEGFWSITRHADCEWAAKQKDLLSSETGGGRDGGGTLIEDLPNGLAAGVLFNMQDDPRHQHIRRLATPTVTPKRLRMIADELSERRNAILDIALQAGECDLVVDIASELPLQAIAGLMGVPQEDRHQFMGWANATLDYTGRELGERSETAAAAGAAMSAYGTELMAEKRRCPADDLLSVVASAELAPEADPGGPLTDLEQLMFFNLLLAAGSETTRNSITAGVLALVEDPQAWADLDADRSLLPSAVEEILRWASSTTYNRRTATAAFTLHDREVAPGDKVVIWWQSANFDERVFETPDRFDIRRAPNPHLAFGVGSHFCLGANLARLEIQLMLEGLLDRVRTIEVTGPVVRMRSNKHTGYRHAPVRLIPR